MKWFWYSARSTELFLDIDNYSKCISHIRQRLQGAIECHALDVKECFVYDSTRPDHKHIIVILNTPLCDVECFVWEIVLHSDIYRGCCNIMRSHNNFPHPDILIGRQLYHRQPDAICECESKHTRSVMDGCQAAMQLRSEYRMAAFFGKPSKNRCNYL
jgi:hypothetical protein